MPDAPVTPAAPATPGTPSITFGGGSGSPAPPAEPAAPKTPPAGGGEGGAGGEGGGAGAGTETQDAPDKFEFHYDGDDEVYSFDGEQTDDTQVAEQYDATKPFDPKVEELLKDSPEILKSLKAGHYELRQLKSELQKAGFKTAKEVKAFKSKIDALGGAEKIEQESGEWASTWDSFSKGDPSVLEKWGKENPEGLTKLSGPMLAWLHKTNPQVWARHMGKVFMSTLQKPNAQGMSALAAFNQLYEIPEVSESPAAQKLLKSIADVINGVHETTQGPEPEIAGAGGADKRGAELDSRARGLYLKELNMQASPVVESAARQAMKVALKGLKISKDVGDEILKDIKSQFNQLQKSDSTFQANARDLLTKQDSDRFLKLLKSAIARNMPKAALREARKYKGISGSTATRRAEGQARTETAGGAAATGAGRMRYTGPMKLGGPDPAQINYAEMRARFGRKETDEMLSRHEFLKKGADPKTIYFW